MTRFWTTIPTRPTPAAAGVPGSPTDPRYTGPGLPGSIADLTGLNAPSNISYPVLRPPPGVEGWRERIENYSPWTDAFSVSEHGAQLVVDIPFENRYLFLGRMLGYSYMSDDRIKRVNPLKHPYWTWLRAHRVALQGVRYDGGKAFSPFSPNGVAKYRLARFTVEFVNYPFPFMEDSEITDPANEYQRNVSWTEQPGSQILAAEGGRGLLYYANPAGMGLAGTPAFRAPFGQVVNSIRYELVWKWVPYDYLFVGRIPAGIYKCLNRVNITQFDGQFEAGTLLLDSVKITKYPAPLRVVAGPALLCDVTLSVLFFDPPRGITAGTGSTIRGHNLIPFRENHNWYPAVRVPSSFAGGPLPAPIGSNQLFDYMDFGRIFRKAA